MKQMKFIFKEFGLEYWSSAIDLLRNVTYFSAVLSLLLIKKTKGTKEKQRDFYMFMFTPE